MAPSCRMGAAKACTAAALLWSLAGKAAAQNSEAMCPEQLTEYADVVTHTWIHNGDCMYDGWADVSVDIDTSTEYFMYLMVVEGCALGSELTDTNAMLFKIPYASNVHRECGSDSDCASDVCSPVCLGGNCAPDFERGMEAWMSGNSTEEYCFTSTQFMTTGEELEACGYSGNDVEMSDRSADSMCLADLTEWADVATYTWVDGRECMNDSWGDLSVGIDTSTEYFVHMVVHEGCSLSFEVSDSYAMLFKIPYASEIHRECESDSDCVNDVCSLICVEGDCAPDFDAGMKALESGGSTEEYCFSTTELVIAADQLESCGFSEGDHSGDEPCEAYSGWSEYGCGIFDEIFAEGADRTYEAEIIAPMCLDVYENYLRCLWGMYPHDQSVGYRSKEFHNLLVEAAQAYPWCIGVPKYVHEQMNIASCDI